MISLDDNMRDILHDHPDSLLAFTHFLDTGLPRYVPAWASTPPPGMVTAEPDGDMPRVIPSHETLRAVILALYDEIDRLSRKCGEHPTKDPTPAPSKPTACVEGKNGRVRHSGPLVVLTRNANRSAFNGYRHTPSAYSAVKCMCCGRHWRSKGAFVDTLPDATPEQARWLPGQVQDPDRAQRLRAEIEAVKSTADSNDDAGPLLLELEKELEALSHESA